jgi:nucleoside recognition membrane protein YjiH
VDGAVIAITIRFAKINGNADNFGFLHELKKHKNIKEEFLRAQCETAHCIL